MGIVMLHTFILGCYRFIALLLVAFPVVLNVIYRGDIVTSLIYVPSIMIVLGFLVTYIGHKLETSLAQVQFKVFVNKTANKPINTQYYCMLYKHLRHTSAH
jgi:hypothetical protein